MLNKLLALKELGFQFICRDKDGELYVFENEPLKLMESGFDYWVCRADSCYIELPKTWFEYITWKVSRATFINDMIVDILDEEHISNPDITEVN